MSGFRKEVKFFKNIPFSSQLKQLQEMNKIPRPELVVQPDSVELQNTSDSHQLTAKDHNVNSNNSILTSARFDFNSINNLSDSLDKYKINETEYMMTKYGRRDTSSQPEKSIMHVRKPHSNMGIKKGFTDLQRIVMTDSDYYDKMTILDSTINAQIQGQMNEMYKTKNDLLREYNLNETMVWNHPK